MNSKVKFITEANEEDAALYAKLPAFFTHRKALDDYHKRKANALRMQDITFTESPPVFPPREVDVTITQIGSAHSSLRTKALRQIL